MEPSTDQLAPIDVLRERHRIALDRQAELATEARALTARARRVAGDLNTVSAYVNTYGALIEALTKPRKPEAK